MTPLLRCPITRQTLAAAPAELTAQLLARLDSLRNRDGEKPEPFEAGFLTADGAWFYPVRQTIPVLLAGEAIAMT